MPDTHSQDAILLIAHGSRRQQANDDLYQLAEMVQQSRPDRIVECSFLDVVEPTIPQGAEKCIAQGAERILLFPYFLSAGTHVVDDLNKFRQQFEKRWPDKTFLVCPHLGLHPLMVEIVFERLAAAEQETAGGHG